MMEINNVLNVVKLVSLASIKVIIVQAAYPIPIELRNLIIKINVFANKGFLRKIVKDVMNVIQIVKIVQLIKITVLNAQRINN